MIQRQRFDPDIEVKYHQIVAHMNQKNKVIEQFCRILKDLCDWEMFNSRNLDKFANSISKLLVGKDPLKDTFILFQRILASKSDQANKVAISIKEDMMPFLQQAINYKDQTLIKSQQQTIKELKLTMHQKIRQLYSAQVNYKGMNEKMKVFNNPNIMQSRERLDQMTRMKRDLLDAQSYLTQVINVYNHAVEDYMLNYSKLCEQLSEIETNRKTTIKESISKYIVFEMDAIKNIEYDLCRHAKSIQKMEDKLIIQQKIPHEITDLKTIQLAKISSNNYIKHLIDRQPNSLNQKDDSGLCFHTQSQRRLNEIKKFLDPLRENCEIKKESYTNLVSDINELLWEAVQVYDIKTVKEIVYYSSYYFMLSGYPKSLNKDAQELSFRRVKIPLLNSILCHPIFANQTFWEKYSNRLSDIVQKQITTVNNTTSRKSDEMRLSLSLLSSDIQFMKKISQSPLVEKILAKYSKYTMESSEHMLKSTDSIKSKTQSTANSKNRFKDKEKNDLQKIEEKVHVQDFIYF